MEGNIKTDGLEGQLDALELLDLSIIRFIIYTYYMF